MKKRRPDLVILVDILAALLEGPKIPTRIAQNCNLNYLNFEMWIKILESRGLVTKSSDRGHETYSLTSDGQQVYQDYKKLMERLQL